MTNQSKISMENTLVLWMNASDYYARRAQMRGAHIAQMYWLQSNKLRVLSKLFRNKIPFIKILFSSWTKSVCNYQVVIAHASILTPPVVEYIHRVNPAAQLIIWYWNPVDKCVPIEKFKEVPCEIWSFDESDCQKYGLRQNTQYFFCDINPTITELKWDVYFIGRDKGRLAELLELKDSLTQLGIICNFHITKSSESDHATYQYQKYLPYDQILDQISQTKAILDYVSDNQGGLTLRAMESLFLKRKLITNDKTICLRDFYRKENIFILGVDNILELKQFLGSPYEPVSSQIVNRYEFSSWFNNFNK